MAYKLFVVPTAKADIRKARAWYERQRAGLGAEFFASVEQTFDKLCRWPDLGFGVHESLKRAPVERFPYGVFYVIEGARIVVVGVIHGRRSPRHWKRRVPKP